MFWSHGLRSRVEKEYAGVAHGHLVVTDPRVTKAADHHLVATILVDVGLSFQVAPHPDLQTNQKKDSTFQYFVKDIYILTQDAVVNPVFVMAAWCVSDFKWNVICATKISTVIV